MVKLQQWEDPFLALLDEAVTTLADWGFTTLLAHTVASAPSADAWLASALMLVCLHGGVQMARLSHARLGTYWWCWGKHAALPLPPQRRSSRTPGTGTGTSVWYRMVPYAHHLVFFLRHIACLARSGALF